MTDPKRAEKPSPVDKSGHSFIPDLQLINAINLAIVYLAHPKGGYYDPL